MKIERIDHLVLTVRDIAATCAFYERVLGMEVITFQGDRKALGFGGQKINLHQAGKEVDPKAIHPTPGSGDLCLIASTPLETVIAHLTECQVEIIAGPGPASGATGWIESVYIRDPDGNLLEISNYIR